MTPRPTLLTAYAFHFYALTSCLALAALGWSAVEAFSLTMERNHATLAAIAFEVAAMTEAVALARARKPGEFVIPALFTVASVAGSAVYNYAQVRNHAAANGLNDPAFLSVFAVGPLFAMIGLAMNAGREWRALELAQAAWDAAQQHAAQSAEERKAREASNAAYDAQRAAEREANRRHELAIAELQARATAQLAPIAVGGGEVQSSAIPAQLPPLPKQDKPARGQSRSAVIALVEKYPGYTNAEYAAALQIDPAQVTRALKDTK